MSHALAFRAACPWPNFFCLYFQPPGLSRPQTSASLAAKGLRPARKLDQLAAVHASRVRSPLGTRSNAPSARLAGPQDFAPTPARDALPESSRPIRGVPAAPSVPWGALAHPKMPPTARTVRLESTKPRRGRRSASTANRGLSPRLGGLQRVSRKRPRRSRRCAFLFTTSRPRCRHFILWLFGSGAGCPGVTYSVPGAAVCERCLRSFFYSTDMEQCLGCPEGASCSEDGGSTTELLVLDKGYWRGDASSPVVYECPLSSACVGGDSFHGDRRLLGGEGYCAEGYSGPLCTGAIKHEGQLALL